MSSLAANTNAGVTFTGLPDERSTYRPRFPVVTKAEMGDLRNALEAIPRKAGYSREFIDSVWLPAVDIRFMPAVVDCGEWVRQKGEGGAVDFEQRLATAQADVARSLQEQGVETYTPIREITDTTIPEIIAAYKEEQLKREKGRIGGGKGEKLWSTLVKVGLSLPQTLMLMKAVHLEPGRSLLIWIVTLAFAFGVSALNQALMRPVAEAYTALGEDEQYTEGAPHHLKRRALWGKLVGLSVAVLVIGCCVALLDATFIQWASSLDRWGNASPNAIPHGTALAMSGAYSVTLSVASLVFALRDAEVATVYRKAELRGEALVKTIAEPREQLSKAEFDFENEQKREAELFAAADSEWYRMLYALYGMSVKAEPEKLAQFLLGPGEACSADPRRRPSLA